MNSLHNPRKGRTRSRSRAKNGRIEKEWCSKQALSPPTKNILLWRRLFREIPAGHVDQHHNQVEANIPELGGMVLASLKEIIELNSLVAAFRRSTLVVHQMPLIAFPRWGGIETNVGLHGIAQVLPYVAEEHGESQVQIPLLFNGHWKPRDTAERAAIQNRHPSADRDRNRNTSIHGRNPNRQSNLAGGSIDYSRS